MLIRSNAIFGEPLPEIESSEFTIDSTEFYDYIPQHESSYVYARYSSLGGTGELTNNWYLIYPEQDLTEIKGEFVDDKGVRKFRVTFDATADIMSCKFKEVLPAAATITNEKITLKPTEVSNELVIKNSDTNYLNLNTNSLTYYGTFQEISLDISNYKFYSYYREGQLSISRRSEAGHYIQSGSIKKPFPIGLTTWKIGYYYSGKEVTKYLSYGELPYTDDVLSVKIEENENTYELEIVSLPQVYVRKYSTITYEYKSEYLLPDNVNVFYMGTLLEDEMDIGIFKVKLEDNKIITTYTSGFEEDGAPTDPDPESDWYNKIEKQPYVGGLYFQNKNTDFNINNNLNITGGMTLGGSLTIPSGQNIEIGEVILDDLEDSSVVEDGYLYSYKGATFLFNEYLHGKNIVVESTDYLQVTLVLPSGSNQPPKIKTDPAGGPTTIVDAIVKKFPIKINSITTS